MASRRLSIAGMLWVVAGAALWFATIRSASVVWTMVAATMTLAALLTAVLGAAFTRGPSRAFWAGFALFGWVYLGFVEWDWVGGPLGHSLTGALSDWADQFIPPVPSPQAVVPAPTLSAKAITTLSNKGYKVSVIPLPNVPNNDYIEAVQQRSIMVGNFVQVGRMTLCLVFALAGGLIGRVFGERQSEPAR